MEVRSVVMDGMLKPDGTVEMGMISALRPGPVRVTVEPLGKLIPPSRDPLEALEEIRRMMIAAGCAGPTIEEWGQREQERREEDEGYEKRWIAIHDQTRGHLESEGPR